MSRLLVASCAEVTPVQAGALPSSPATRPADADGVLMVAPIAGDAAISLGAFQRAASAVDLEGSAGRGLTLVRRWSGGPALRIGPGQVWFCLALRSPSALGGIEDPSRAINRHVRPLLAALGRVGGAGASWGGRDFVLSRGAPVAWVGVRHERASDAWALEGLVSVTGEAFALDPALDLAHGGIAERFLGRSPRALADVLGRPLGPAEVAAAIVEAYAARSAPEVARVPWPTAYPEAIARAIPAADEPPFEAMVEEAIGLLGARVEPGRVALGGDLMASHDALDELSRALFALGEGASDEAVDALVAEKLGPQSGAMLLGVRSLASLRKVAGAAWAAARARS